MKTSNISELAAFFPENSGKIVATRGVTGNAAFEKQRQERMASMERINADLAKKIAIKTGAIKS